MQLATSKVDSPQLHPILLEKNNLLGTSKILPRRTSLSLHSFETFRGEIVVDDLSLPSQRFSHSYKDDYVVLRNHPTDSFPNIEIVLQKSDSKITDFKIERSDNSVLGELLYTRVFLTFAESNSCYISIKDINFSQSNLRFKALEKDEKIYMLRRAKLARKLRFLEIFFKTIFNLPEEFDSNDIKQTDIIFRGITEGEFKTATANSITVFNYKLTKEDLQNLSFPERKSFSFEFDEDLMVLGKFFSIGKMTFNADKAAIANPRSLRNLSVGNVVPQLRLSIFDYQVEYSFEKYLNKERLLKNRQKLVQFKNALRKEEPEFLIDLIEEPLSEVTETVAIEIVTGWLQYYDFPDRYTVGEPILEGENWRVPILLTYPKEKSIWIEDALVSSKTGIIEISSSVEQLRKKGKKKALEVFSVV